MRRSNSASSRQELINGKTTFGKRLKQWQMTFGIISLLLPFYAIRPAIGAERINLNYGILEQSIPIVSLETFAKTGKVDRVLADYARYASPEQLAQFRQLLRSRIPLDVVTVSQFLYTPIGERLLDRLGEVIQTDARQPGFYGIRAALILAAADPQGFTPLAVLRQFPTRGIHIDLAQSLAIVDNLQTLVNQTNQAVNQVQRQARQEAAAMPLPASLSSKNLEKPGPYHWNMRTITLKDRQRNRTFPADIYLPSLSTPRPLIVISHGLGSDRNSFAYLAQHLASYGFAVAVPEHPGSDANQLQALFQGLAARVTRPREFIDRPLDITYLLNELERLSRSDPAFEGRLNLQEIGVVGQSYGGYTALALAGAKLNFPQLQTNCPALDDSLNLSLVLQCLALQLPKQSYNLADPRIKAAIAIDPVDSSIMGQSGLSQIQIPTMIVAGSADTVAPALPEQIQPFTWLTTPNKYLVLIDGGTHFSTIAESPDAAIPVPAAVIGSDPTLARRYMRALSVAFFQTYVANQPSYRPFLSAAYTNRLSQNPLPLSIVQFLSPKDLDAERSTANSKWIKSRSVTKQN
jgi:predicted dienelactone hydrolase